ncbi:single-stranded DNA-binding protein [Candidatus Microgenomates bacterium]|nr:single-stranded DNA-binding protein [Candidatus Microgenomates bacterium]
MANKSLNKVQLIGNMTRDPELRYTPTGAAVCTFSVATNRSWATESGEKKEEAEFHRVVAWNKLAEICSQLLLKGRRVYIEGRLATRSWQGQDGAQRQTTEIVCSDMIILDSKGMTGGAGEGLDVPADLSAGPEDLGVNEPSPEEAPTEGAEAAVATESEAQPKGGKRKGKEADSQEEGEMPF